VTENMPSRECCHHNVEIILYFSVNRDGILKATRSNALPLPAGNEGHTAARRRRLSLIPQAYNVELISLVNFANSVHTPYGLGGCVRLIQLLG